MNVGRNIKNRNATLVVLDISATRTVSHASVFKMGPEGTSAKHREVPVHASLTSEGSFATNALKDSTIFQIACVCLPL